MLKKRFNWLENLSTHKISIGIESNLSFISQTLPHRSVSKNSELLKIGNVIYLSKFTKIFSHIKRFLIFLSVDPLFEARFKLKTEIRESITVASELKAYIKTSTADSSKKNFYIASINSAKNLLFLLNQIATGSRITLVLKYLFEAEGLMQNIIQDWNYENPMPFGKIFERL